jgi:hypothetical protein
MDGWREGWMEGGMDWYVYAIMGSLRNTPRSEKRIRPAQF